MSNEAGIEYVGTAVDGVSLGVASGKASVYGEAPVEQASAIVAVVGTVSLTTTINAILTAIRNFGIIA
jgi:hypothetical protein